MKRDRTNDAASSQNAKDGSFSLQTFFPYLARVYYTQVSGAVSRLYSEQYGMKRYEWRTMAILGQSPAMSAREIVDASSMDKVSVSRAITGLRKRGWIVEKVNMNDARSRVLKLSDAGEKVYRTLIPQMIALEEKLLSQLSTAEVEALKSLMARVTETASALNEG